MFINIHFNSFWNLITFFTIHFWDHWCPVCLLLTDVLLVLCWLTYCWSSADWCTAGPLLTDYRRSSADWYAGPLLTDAHAHCTVLLVLCQLMCRRSSAYWCTLQLVLWWLMYHWSSADWCTTGLDWCTADSLLTDVPLVHCCLLPCQSATDWCNVRHRFCA